MSNQVNANTAAMIYNAQSNYKEQYGRWCMNKEEIYIAIDAIESNKIIFENVIVEENGSLNNFH